jgi:hypothetical protein
MQARDGSRLEHHPKVGIRSACRTGFAELENVRCNAANNAPGFCFAHGFRSMIVHWSMFRRD